MYTIQKYLETNMAACVLFSTYSSPWGGRGVQCWALFFKAEEYQCFPPSPGSNLNDARKGLCLCPGTYIICKQNWTLGKGLGLVSNDSPSPLGKNSSHGN